MRSTFPESLYWLLPPPPDFRTRLKAVGEAVEGATLRDFAMQALDLNQLTQLAKLRASRTLVQDGVLSAIRLAYLSDLTTDYVGPAIVASGFRHGVDIAFYAPHFGQMSQDLADPASPLVQFQPDVVLLAFDHRALGFGGDSLGSGAVEAALATAEQMISRVRAMGAQPLVATLAAPPERWCGHLDGALEGSVAGQVAAFNAGLVALAKAGGAILFDVAALAALVGSARWHDPAQYHSAKLPFAMDFVPLYADHVARILGAIRGKARKCLVLDLDNTLWGGIIGDDGLEGIALGAGSAEGEAYRAIQAYALALKARGIILAVCSKNEEDAARLPFREHPEMLLRETDIAVFVANWTDKATNLSAIAKTLNIGIDALTFLDDNPAERARVRQMLPQVAVPEVPDDPAWYPAAVAQAGYFETVTLSADDAQRAEQYRANAERAAAMQLLGDIGAYHRSLEMRCEISRFDDVGRARITQLINKSNQYNLTTRRYTEAEVADVASDPQKFAMQIRLADRFGDNGMISVVIFDRGEEAWVCDTWLMSCRVIGRRVEEAALGVVAQAARTAGAKRLLGSYVPSAKNRMVADHFARLGFTRLSGEADGASEWELVLDGWEAPELPMELVASL